MSILKTAIIAVLAIVFSSIIANAHEYEKGTLFIMHPNIPQPAKGAPVSAGYMEIHNTGEEEEVLLGVSSSFSEKAQIHKMEVVDDVARMRPVKHGIVIPAGGKIKLEQGGLHLMFLKMDEKLEEGQLKDVILTFKNAGDVEIGMIVVEQIAAHRGHGDHSDHSSHSDHNTN